MHYWFGETSLLYTDSSHYDSLKLLWERDLEVTFNPVNWDKICSQVFPKSISIQERTLKLVMLLCWMFPSNLCYKCSLHKGTVIHLFWSCDCIQTFWKGVHSVIQEVTGKQFLLTPSFSLLNHAPDNFSDTDSKSLLIILLLLAKQCIL